MLILIIIWLTQGCPLSNLQFAKCIIWQAVTMWGQPVNAIEETEGQHQGALRSGDDSHKEQSIPEGLHDGLVWAACGKGLVSRGEKSDINRQGVGRWAARVDLSAQHAESKALKRNYRKDTRRLGEIWVLQACTLWVTRKPLMPTQQEQVCITILFRKANPAKAFEG